MKPLLMNIAKAGLILLACLLVLLIAFGAVLALGWPWWTGVFVLLGLLGLIIGAFVLKKLLSRKREQDFVNQIVEQDNRRLKGMGDREREQSKALQERWKEAIDTLKRSHLRKYGNPLYVLPWYLVIGESGSGKTTAIKSARLSSPFAGEIHASGISGTKNCDWWFFDEAVLIDTAGRYSVPVDEGRDKDEWNKFLNLLTKYRKKEPLNGLIVTIAADKLLKDDPHNLEQEGIQIRRRIDELMLALGAKSPVYVLVTKCDLIQGMTQFCDQLPEDVLAQPMGSINEELTRNGESFLTKALDSLGERLRKLRLLLVHREKGEAADSGLLLFPEEFERVRPGLSAFIKGVSQENPYQETPLMRGLFFSSGRQEGTPYSHFLKSLGLIEAKEVLPGTNKGLFLHDFFAKILPSDRSIFAPTQKALQWNRLTRNLGLTSWVAVALAVCGLLSFSFVKNLSTMREVSREFEKPVVLKGQVVSDIGVLDRFRRAVLRVHEENEGWWMPRFGLDASEKIETRLQKKYCVEFKKGFMDPLDALLFKRMSGFTSNTPDEVLARDIAYLVRRINLLRSRLKADDLRTMQRMPVPPYEAVMFQSDQDLVPEIKGKLANLYLYYLDWDQDSTSLNRRLTELQKWLAHMVELKESNLNWLVAWADHQPGLSPVALQDFWGGNASPNGDETVQPAFTRAGRNAIEAFLKELESALPDPGPPMIAGQERDFATWYRHAYLEAWFNFGTGFSKGARNVEIKDVWQQTVAKTADTGGPYFALLDRMARELGDFGHADSLPAWVKLVFQFQTLKTQAAQMEGMKTKSTLGKALPKGKRLISTIERTLSGAGKDETAEVRLKGGKALLVYEKALKQLEPLSESRKLAFKEAEDVFSEDPATGKSPFFTADQSVSRLKTLIGTGQEDEKMFWDLLDGPMTFIWYFVRSQAACHLQSLWEKDVLVEIQGISGRNNIRKILLGPDGFATKFVKGPAAPFLSVGLRRGYYPKRVLDGDIPFTDPFLTFLTKGVEARKPLQASYDVTITGLPTDVNPGAKMRPQATHLEMQCGNTTQDMDNYQYPVRKTFKWSPDSCGDVVFRIEVGNLKLTKRYEGSYGFPKFLKDFRSGQRIFYRKEFPDEEAALKRLGIRYIRAYMRFKGNGPLIALLESAPGRVPEKIATCWTQANP